MQPRSGDALGGTFVWQRRKVFRRRQRLYGLLARVSRTGSTKDRLYPIKNAFLPRNYPTNFPTIRREKKAADKTKTIYCIWTHIPYTIYGIRGWGSWIRTNEWRSQRHSENSKNGWKQPKNPIKSLDFDYLPHNLPHNCVVGHKRRMTNQGAHRNSDALLEFQ